MVKFTETNLDASIANKLNEIPVIQERIEVLPEIEEKIAVVTELEQKVETIPVIEEKVAVIPEIEEKVAGIREIELQLASIRENAIIEESGSNTNGRYVKFADGTLICTQEVAGGASISISDGSVFSMDDKLWTFPHQFMAESKPAISVNFSGQGGWGSSRSTAPERLAWYTLYASQKITNSSHTISLMAVGRWK